MSLKKFTFRIGTIQMPFEISFSDLSFEIKLEQEYDCDFFYLLKNGCRHLWTSIPRTEEFYNLFPHLFSLHRSANIFTDDRQFIFLVVRQTA